MRGDVPVFELISTGILLYEACEGREGKMVQKTTGWFCIFFRSPLVHFVSVFRDTWQIAGAPSCHQRVFI